MHGRRWLEGTLPDPEARYRCDIFDALIATLGGDLLAGGAVAGLDAGGIGALAGGGLEAGIGGSVGLGELVGAGAGGEFLGAGAGALDLGAGAGGVAGIADTAGGLSGAFSGAPGVVGGEFGASALPVTTEALPAATTTAVSPAATAAAPVGIAPAVPAAVTDSTAAITGSFGGEATVPAGDVAGTGGGSATSGITGALDRALGGIGLTTKDLSLATSVGGLGMNLLNRHKPIPGERQLSDAAGSLATTAGAQANQGRVLEDFVNTGHLPPGLADGLKTATTAAEASIRSGYAARGMSGSSAEAQDIQAAHERAQSAAAALALNLLQQGSAMVGQSASTEGLAAKLYGEIMKNALAEDASLGAAIGNFSGALSGASGTGGNTITMKVGP